MSRFRNSVAGLLLGAALAAPAMPGAAQTSLPGIGRAATPAEIAAWDIDVRPDFKGLPAGQGSVAKGQQLWEAQCASCHGVFGESNQFFSPLIGGTTADDIRSGRVANLTRTDYPQRTTLMRAANLSTLWDYVNRAMPWNKPKSLSVDEVYAVTAYMLHLGDIVPAGFTLSDQNIRDVQQRMPNRNGMDTAHALWPGPEMGGGRKADVAATACMKNCATDVQVASTLPAHARHSHGNLRDQNRHVGPQRGADTTRAEADSLSATAQAARLPAPVLRNGITAEGSNQSGATVAAMSGDKTTLEQLLKENSCTGCHAARTTLLGPSWADIAKKHGGNADYLAGKIRSGGAGVWGAIAMPPQSLSEPDTRRIAEWLAAGAGR